jgi:hypothetical protein
MNPFPQKKPSTLTIRVISFDTESEPEPWTKDTNNQLEFDEYLLFAYIRGEPVIGILQMTTVPLTVEFDEPQFSYSRKMKTISRLTKSLTSSRYCIAMVMLLPKINIQAKTSVSQQHGSEKDQAAQKRTLGGLLPEHYREYKWVFEKSAQNNSQSHDHGTAIDLKLDFVPWDCKVYPLAPIKQDKMNEFLDENLKKGYIRPSKSPMASPFFFIAKKEANALRPCQDYRCLNDGMIKNAYPFPLVSDLLDK